MLITFVEQLLCATLPLHVGLDFIEQGHVLVWLLQIFLLDTIVLLHLVNELLLEADQLLIQSLGVVVLHFLFGVTWPTRRLLITHAEYFTQEEAIFLVLWKSIFFQNWLLVFNVKFYVDGCWELWLGKSNIFDLFFSLSSGSSSRSSLLDIVCRVMLLG